MNRLHLALIVSVTFHVGLVGVAGSSILNHPDISLTAGESRLAIVYVEKEVQTLKPQTPVEPLAQQKVERNEVQESKEEVNLAQSTPSEGVIWVEPQYLVNKPPVYPRKALLRNIQGRVVLIVDIDVEGKPSRVQIETSAGSRDLDRAALKAVEEWVFQPATVNDEVVPSRTRVPIHFVIKR